MSGNGNTTARLPPPQDSSTTRYGAAGAGRDRTPEESARSDRPETVEPSRTKTLLEPGVCIADRYKIRVGHFGGANADIYRCTDIETEQELALKLYRERAPRHPKAAERLHGFAHRNIVILYDSGIWRDYAYEVMEFCSGGTLADRIPLSEEDVCHMLPSILDALSFLHKAGIVHRDIKPTNILFRSTELSEPVLADFDISSLFEASVGGVRHTESGGNFTIDYASPELIEQDQIGPKTDFYALGITIAHALIGHSPFDGMRREQIVVSHLRGRVPIRDHLSEKMQTLIFGLTDRSADNRWGPPQIRAWQRGDTVLDDQSHEWQASAGIPIPYPGFPEARTPSELASCLAKFDAENELYRTDDIGRWVFDHFDAELARRIRAISDDFARDRRLGLQKLRYLLDPTLPLNAGKHTVKSLSEFDSLLASEDQHVQSIVARLLFSRELEIWIDAVQPAGEKSAELAEKLAALRQRLRNNNEQLAVFSLLHILRPARKVELEPGLEAANPTELAALLSPKREWDRASFQDFLFSRKFEEWLSAAEFKDWKVDSEFLEDCRKRHGDARQIACFGALCRFGRNVPLAFGSEVAVHPRELARLVDRDRRSQQLGIELLQRGWIRIWLVGSGRLEDHNHFDRVIESSNVSWESKLESVLQLLHPALRRPLAVPVPTALNLGDISQGGQRTGVIRIDNASRGHLAGEVHVSEGSRGVSIEDSHFEGARTNVRVTVNTAGVVLGSRQEAELSVTSNGGTFAVPIRYRAVAPLWSMLARSIAAGMIVAAPLAVLRALVPDGAGEWTLAGLGLGLLAVVAGYGYWLFRTWWRLG